jgi:hypothetical protein
MRTEITSLKLEVKQLTSKIDELSKAQLKVLTLLQNHLSSSQLNPLSKQNFKKIPKEKDVNTEIVQWLLNREAIREKFNLVFTHIPAILHYINTNNSSFFDTYKRK